MEPALRNPNYIALNESVTTAGAIVWWRMSGGVTLNNLTHHWRFERLDESLLPATATPAERLRRACLDLQEARLLMRPLGRGKGFAVVRETPNDQDDAPPLDHKILATVKLNADDELDFQFVTKPTEVSRFGIVPDGMPEDFPEMLKARFMVHGQELSAHDISQWVIGLLGRLRAVGLRQRGGIYFVPNNVVGLWNSFKKAIEMPSNHKFFGVPAMKSTEAVEAILDAVEREAQALADTIKKELCGKIKPGKLALKGKEEALLEMEEKLGRYEEMLGAKSKTFPDLKTEVQASITRAIFALDANDNLSLPL